MPAEFSELDGYDAYELLGVDPDASRQEIKNAHRGLAKASHPDLFADPEGRAWADKRIRLLNAARQILDSRRAAYDTFRTALGEGEPLDAEIIDDPWAAAEPGPPPPSDPWHTAHPGRPPAPPGPGMPPPYYRPMRPQRYRYPPPPWLHTPPVHRRRLTPKRFAVVWAVVGGLMWLVAAAALVRTVASSSNSGPEPTAAVPGPLAGTWEGTVTETSKGKAQGAGWKAKLTLSAGRSNGEVDYLTGKCTGTAVPVSYGAGRLTVKTVFPSEDAGCDVGNLQITSRTNSRLTITFHDGGTVSASGILARLR